MHPNFAHNSCKPTAINACMSHRPHPSHLRPHTSRITPHNSDLTPHTLQPHTSHLTPDTSVPHTIFQNLSPSVRTSIHVSVPQSSFLCLSPFFSDSVHFSELQSKLHCLNPLSLPHNSDLRPHTSQPHTSHHIPHSLTTFLGPSPGFQSLGPFFNASVLRSSLSLSLCLSFSLYLSLSLSLPSLSPSLSLCLSVSLSLSLTAFVFSSGIEVVSFCNGFGVTGSPKLHWTKKAPWPKGELSKGNRNSNVIAVSVLESKHCQRQASRMTESVTLFWQLLENCLLHAFRAAEYDVWYSYEVCERAA